MGQAGCTTVSRVHLIDCEQQISSWYSYKMIELVWYFQMKVTGISDTAETANTEASSKLTSIQNQYII